MSTIQVIAKAASQAGKVLREDSQTTTIKSAPEHQDQEMMFAWSIGVTDAARPNPQHHAEQECPPEVYIG